MPFGTIWCLDLVAVLPALVPFYGTRNCTVKINPIFLYKGHFYMQILVLRSQSLYVTRVKYFLTKNIAFKGTLSSVRNAGSYSNIYIGLITQQPGISLKEHLKYNSFLKGKEGNQIL